MTKIKISKKQYDTIILREQESRLKASSAILNENLDESTQLLSEGWREVVLGVAMMLGIGLTGQNKIMAQNAVKNDSTMAQIKSTLEDETKIGELVDSLKAKGMKDPETKLATNAEKVVDTYNRIAADDDIKYKVDIKAVNNLQALKGKLAQGYALKNADITTDTVYSKASSTPVSIQDTMDVNFGSDNLFVTGGYTLSPAGVDTIKLSIEEIIKQGGKILSIEIESSIDAERVVKFMNENDPTGNIKLANLRTQSVSNLISSLANGVAITHREIPNNGSHIVSTQDFIKAAKDPKVTTALREKTSEYRYTKIKIVAIFDTTEIKPTQHITDFIKKYRFEVVKVIESTGNSRKIKSHVIFKNKRWKSTKSKGDNRKYFTF